MNNINQMEPWIGDEEKRAVAEYLDAGGWLTEFKKTREFERKIADFTGSKYSSVVTNGTVSLMIAVMALGIKGEDEIIVPDYTMIASPNSIVLSGAKPVLVDIDPSTLCLDLELTERAITSKTKAIMHVSINGRCGNMDELMDLTRKHNLSLIEDAAQSLGSRYKGRHLGTFGDIGSFSFSAPKIITTGQGGALITNNEEIYQKIFKIRDFGRPKTGVDYHESMGFNAKFTDLQAVIGIEQLKKLEWRVKRKKEMYRHYCESLSGISQIEFILTNLDDCSPWFIDILVSGENTRDRLGQYLNEKGIGTRPFYPAIHSQSPYSHIKGHFQNSIAISKKGLWLPSSSFLTDLDIDRVCLEIKDFFKRI